MLQQHKKQALAGVVIQENMSNFTPPPPSQTHGQVNKKKRSLPGNPDPDAEVIALSPKTLMATNRFLCEICGKGFQRDQNLQLHRRGHNLPWKLKQRTKTEVVRKKVYVCPEPTCVHHDPGRALGDLTGIKKHFSRKHGEKKWKCDKCSKKYAVQSDWKAHSKTCGTREYRCDCGTLFSRRDSFITHRAFCDALAEESARAVTAVSQSQSHEIHGFSLKQEQQSSFSTMTPWLDFSSVTTTTTTPRLDLDEQVPNRNPNPSGVIGPTAHMSATALLQKAAQMGATTTTTTVSSSAQHSQSQLIRTHPQGHVSDTFGLNLSSRDDPTAFAHHGFFPPPASSPSLLHHVINSFDDAFGANDGAGEGMTRDFLGLRPLSHSDILTIAGISNCINSTSSSSPHHHHQKPWQG
ncbi:Protein indeterminate-domain [Arachis hypogaea]|nr:Protein indeterminate-domain [Arachis hypogaea]